MEEEKKKGADYSSMRLERLFRVLECMAEFRRPTRLIDIAKKLELPQSTVYRYVQALVHQGYAYVDEPTGNYALTWRVCKVGEAVHNQMSLRNIANPYLHKIVDELGLNTCLVIMEGNHSFYLDFLDAPDAMGAATIRIGKNAPIHTSGSGKVLLSGMPDSKIVEILGYTGLVALTPKTITNLHVFMTEIEKVRKQGYAIDDEECEEGKRCVSVPVFDYAGKTIAAISVFSRSENLILERISEEVVPFLKKMASAISYRLGYGETSEEAR